MKKENNLSDAERDSLITELIETIKKNAWMMGIEPCQLIEELAEFFVIEASEGE